MSLKLQISSSKDILVEMIGKEQYAPSKKGDKQQRREEGNWESGWWDTGCRGIHGEEEEVTGTKKASTPSSGMKTAVH